MANLPHPATMQERPIIQANPMRFVKIGSENAHLRDEKPKTYHKLMGQAKEAIKEVKKEWRKRMRATILGKNATNKQISKYFDHHDRFAV